MLLLNTPTRRDASKQSQPLVKIAIALDFAAYVKRAMIAA